MSRNQVILSIIILISFTLISGAETTSLNYKSFCTKLENGEIAEFTIYQNYEPGVDATATDVNGTLYIVDRPFNYEEDDIFLAYMENKNVTTQILNDVYQGELPAGYGERFGFEVFSWVLFSIPVILLIAIMMMSKTISRQSKTIEILVGKIDPEQESTAPSV